MPKTMYFIKVQMADRTNEYKQITGKEFYSLVRTEKGKKRRFIRLAGDDQSDEPTIVIETTEDQYRKWRSEYDAERYNNHKRKYLDISYEWIRDEVEEPEGGIDPQEYVIGREIADRIREVYRELDEKEKKIFSMKFIQNPPVSTTKIAEDLGMTRTSVSRRVKKIQELILKRL